MRHRRIFLLGALLLSGCAQVSDQSEPPEPTEPVPAIDASGREIAVTPLGPTQEMIDAVKARLDRSPAVQSVLRGTRHRLLSFELTEAGKGEAGDPSSDGFRATYFDYTHNRAYVVTGGLAGGEIAVEQIETQPEPSEEEFEEAANLLRRDRRIGSALEAGALEVYPPMPPLANADRPVSEVERMVNVGVAPTSARELQLMSRLHEIVGVNMIRGSTSRFEGGAPAASVALPAAICGPANAGQSTTTRGTAGSFNVVIRRGGVELWNLVVVRPSVSSGRRGSGIELRNVRYRGKLVFGRAHVPILNVKYDADRCGPFRDWQWQEGTFVAEGVNAASGIRRTTIAPQTAVDTEIDRGNFRGIAIYDGGAEVQLVSEMNAGWYRYVMKWLLRDDGTIQPRFGFGAVANSCVCNVHFHHAYWRFDLDVVSTRNSVCAPTGDGRCLDVTTETRLATIPGGLHIRNSAGIETYALTPGPTDGLPDAFSRATAWILAYNDAEIDDGVNCTSGSSCRTAIDIDRFVNGQPVASGDVVLWYRSSFKHQESAVDDGPHIVGPELRPITW